jgi:hypothetical protein
MDARQELAGLIRVEAQGAEPGRSTALGELADRLEALPKNHRTARVLRNVRPFERREFPNATACACSIHAGGTVGHALADALESGRRAGGCVNEPPQTTHLGHAYSSNGGQA